MKKAAHLTKLDDLGDPKVHQLVSELSHATNWYPEGTGNLSLFTFLQEWVLKGGGRKVTAKHFPVTGVWYLRIPELPHGQLRSCLEHMTKLKGGSIEQFGNCRVLEVIKKLFR